MDRIAEIVRLQKLAQESEEEVTRNRWPEAKLIWEELQDKSFRDLSKDIREAGGSGYSNGHLHRMKQCWELFGREHEIDGDYPPFNKTYHLPEVRGSDGKEGGGGGGGDGSGQGGRHRRDEPDYSATGLVTMAANAIDALHRNKAYLPLLTDDDKRILREVYADFQALIHDIGR